MVGKATLNGLAEIRRTLARFGHVEELRLTNPSACLTSQCSDFLGVLTVDAVDLVQQSLATCSQDSKGLSITFHRVQIIVPAEGRLSLRLLDPKLGQITAQQLPAALLEHLFGLVQFHIQPYHLRCSLCSRNRRPQTLNPKKTAQKLKPDTRKQ